MYTMDNKYCAFFYCLQGQGYLYQGQGLKSRLFCIIALDIIVVSMFNVV